jgi:hypothetical protein
MEVAKAIRALSTGTVIPTTNKFRKTWSRRRRDIVAVPVRHPTNSDFLAECVCRMRTTAPRVKSPGGPQPFPRHDLSVE